MSGGIRGWFIRLVLIGSCLFAAACGGDDGGEAVTGDSPEGVPLEQVQPDGADAQEGEGEAIPLGPSGVEPEEFGNDDSPTDGQ